jgi:hypothetical protein
MQGGPGNTTIFQVYAETPEFVGVVGSCIALAAEAQHLTTQTLEWGDYKAGGNERGLRTSWGRGEQSIQMEQ